MQSFLFFPPRYRARVLSALLPGALLAAGWAGAAQPGTPPAPRFVDLVDYPANEANWDRFYGLEDHLAAAFFAACADQACLPQRLLWPMQLRCSVEREAGEVAACIWVIAGSDLRVRAVGTIKADVVVWRCVLPITTGVPVEDFHAALEVPEPLQVRLPGASGTLLQGVRDCLAGPGSTS